MSRVPHLAENSNACPLVHAPRYIILHILHNSLQPSAFTIIMVSEYSFPMSECDLLEKIATLLENQQDEQRQTRKIIGEFPNIEFENPLSNLIDNTQRMS
jgi:hypothetical protein